MGSSPAPKSVWVRIGRRSLSLAALWLLIEFHDELAYGAFGAALPAIRLDLDLSYTQIGFLLALPGVISSGVEPALLLLGATTWRRKLIAAGGLTVGLAFALAAVSMSFPVLLVALVLAYPAGGAFIGLSQASLMDAHPGSESQAMARWNLAAAIGALAGPLVTAGALGIGVGWRPALLLLGGLGAMLGLASLRARIPSHLFPRAELVEARTQDEQPPSSVRPSTGSGREHVRGLWSSLRGAAGNSTLVRWILLLHASDLGLDIFTGYVPLYLVDVVGATPAQAALAVAVLSGSDIVASALLIPWLRHRGAIPLLRRSAILAGLAFGAWFAVPGFVGKILLLIVIGFCRAPWYPVMQGEAYASHPGRSSAVAALTSISGPIGAGMAWVIGWTAQQAGIGPALLIVLLSPIALAAFVPRRVKNVQ